MLRLAVLLGNLGVLVFILVQLWVDYPPDGDELLVLLLIGGVAFLSLVLASTAGGGAGAWLKLYFERKALEERARIAELKRAQGQRPTDSERTGS
jgi:hypothetical protein